jgi:LPXTG-motif cell wall-anchored protein
MPTQPSGPKNTQTTGTGTKTGDPTRAALPAAAGATALAGLLIILAQKKRHNQ